LRHRRRYGRGGPLGWSILRGGGVWWGGACVCGVGRAKSRMRAGDEAASSSLAAPPPPFFPFSLSLSLSLPPPSPFPLFPAPPPPRSEPTMSCLLLSFVPLTLSLATRFIVLCGIFTLTRVVKTIPHDHRSRCSLQVQGPEWLTGENTLARKHLPRDAPGTGAPGHRRRGPAGHASRACPDAATEPV
jgi:hypothetical protein